MSAHTVEILRRARVLIERGHTQRAFARDATGKRVAVVDPDAVRYSIDGAVLAASNCGPGCGDALQALRDQIDCDLTTWNDRFLRMPWQVKRLFDRAIAKQEAQS